MRFLAFDFAVQQQQATRLPSARRTASCASSPHSTFVCACLVCFARTPYHHRPPLPSCPPPDYPPRLPRNSYHPSPVPSSPPDLPPALCSSPASSRPSSPRTRSTLDYPNSPATLNLSQLPTPM
eukprot:936820-Rhodomonas_salina.1